MLMESDKEYMEVAVGGSTISDEEKPGQGQGGGRPKRLPDQLFDWAETELYGKTFERYLQTMV